MWDDWLKGITAMVAAGCLVGLYFLHWLSDPAYAMLLAGLLAGGGALATAIVSLTPPSPRLVQLTGPVVAFAAGAIALAGAHQVLFPEEPYSTATLSGTQRTGTLVVPTSGIEGAYLKVKGRPGASPSGRDSVVELDLQITGKALERRLSFELYKNKSGSSQGGKKGVPLGRRDSQLVWLDGLSEGAIGLELVHLKPEAALPVEISLHWPAWPPGLLATALWVLLGLAAAVSVVAARARRFPFVLPYSLVLVTVNHFIASGLSPDQPLLPLLGIVLGGGIVASAAGYGLGKLLVHLLAPRQETA